MASEVIVQTTTWKQNARDATGRFVDEKLTALIAEDARINCPVKTNKLRASIRHVGNKIFCGGPGIEYWFYVEYGTRPHEIRPVNVSALHWEDAHGEHFAKLVHHPGTKANPFLRNALYKYRTAL